MISIVDYGMGNMGSMANMFKKIGAKALIHRDPDEIAKAERIILPGVGAFDSAMTKISGIEGLREVLYEMAMVKQVPVLGVCLGMQLLLDSSQEGKKAGLGWIPGEVQLLPASREVKVPHMGWNEASPCVKNHLTTDLPTPSRFYFVHSYFVRLEQPSMSIMTTTHGIKFCSAFCSENIFGVQFHPEKSHRFGMALLQNFLRL